MPRAMHIPRPSLGLLLSLCVTLCCHRAGCQVISNEVTGTESQGPSDTGMPKKDTLEETVFAEMLRIVDQKFDSLSARITALERSVGSLNFYSVRQFREITEGLALSATATEGLRSQVSKMDADDRALKAAVSQVGRDINVIKTDFSIIKTDVGDIKTDVNGVKTSIEALKSDSSKMFDDIANSIVYFNQNVREKSEGVEASVKEAVAAAAETISSQSSEDTAILIKYLEDLDLTRARNCNVNFRPLEERIDLRFAEMKRQTHIHFVDLINADHSSSEESTEEEDEEVMDEEVGEAFEDGEHPQDPLTGQRRRATPRARLAHRRGEAGRSMTAEEEEGDGEKVMRLLANMTQNVMEAVSYFRHTGSMLERLLASSEAMAEEQIRLRYDVLEASGLLSPEGGEVLFEELVNNLPEGGQQISNVPGLGGHDAAAADDLGLDSKEQENTNVLEQPAEAAGGSRSSRTSSASTQGKVAGLPHRVSRFGSAPPHTIGSRGGPPTKPAGAGGGGGGGGVRMVAEESLKVLAELAKNGTQLLDVLTDLAQLSSTSLTKAVGSLHEEVVRLEDVRARLNEGLLLPGKAAAGTGGGQDSASGHPAAHRGLSAPGGDLRSLHNTTKTIFTIVEAIASNTGWIPYIFHNMQHVERLTNRTLELAKRSLLTMHWNRPQGNQIPIQAQERRLQGQEPLTQAEALDVIYSTNVKLQRILPALTKLLAEPEALVALAEGKNSYEGRVEVFYRGRWGAVCCSGMGHNEASAVCTHLGYNGGIWAGEGQFGHGDGPMWQLNLTCLHTHLCPYVVNTSSPVDCPDGHFAVVCDHMLRMRPVPGVNDVNTGLVWMHHQGRWQPVCGHAWSGYEARVACKQLGFRDGRELAQPEDAAWRQTLGDVTSWVSGISCSGDEIRLDSCKVHTFRAEDCAGGSGPAAVRCQ